MKSFPFYYDLPLFRPPSEAASLILQVTLGCSWNRCTFCEMYKTKKFSFKDEDTVSAEIRKSAVFNPQARKIFLADGDALVLPARSLMKILGLIKDSFPKVRRVSSYALPKNILSKSVEELIQLREAGLSLIYLGIESGNDELLKRINKGENARSITNALLKAKEAGIKSSVIIINGLGGRVFSEEHALDSARVLNAAQPEYLSTLVLTFSGLKAASRFESSFGTDYEPLDRNGLFKEMALILQNTDLKNTVFRSDHSSNYLPLKGILGRDKVVMMKKIRMAMDSPELSGLREEWQRGL